MYYEDSFSVAREGSVWVVRDFYGAEVFRSAARGEADFVVLWAASRSAGV